MGGRDWVDQRPEGRGSWGFEEGLRMGPLGGGGGGSPARDKWGTQPGWAPGPRVCTIWFAIKLKIFQLGKKVFCENIWYVKYISIKLIKIEFD